MLFYILSWLIASFLQGLFFFCIMCCLLYWFYIKELLVNKLSPNKPQFENYEFNQTLKDMTDPNKSVNTSETSSSGSSNGIQDIKGNCDGVIALNVIFQFLFQELKDTKAVRRYIVRKMSAEFKELIETKSAGKILKKITAKDFSLGTSFPVIHSLKLDSYQMDHSQKTLEEMSVIVDLEYTNGFSISIDADLILGRSAYIHIKVVSIKGKARIQFSRNPFTHWNFAFVEEPAIEFDANSHFDGRQIPQITALILNQLRKSVRRKHTLPNYKCRYKPFFDQIYTQNLYKANIDEMLLKNSTSTTNTDPFIKQHSNISNSSESSTINSNVGIPKSVSMNSICNEDIALTNIQQQLNEFQTIGISVNGEPIVAQNEITKLPTSLKPLNSDKNTSYQYRKLCEKLGFDLTTVGELLINFKHCDRLPEALYSLNQQHQINAVSSAQTPTHQTNNLPYSLSTGSLNDSKDSCFIYLTASLDQVSMKSLMSKQICKEHWPLFEFELVKPLAQQSNLGFILMDYFLINRNEVVIQKLIPNTPASALISKDLVKPFDIIYSVNQLRITSTKHFIKLINKTVSNTPLKFIVQRPCILMENRVNSSSSNIIKKNIIEQQKQTINQALPTQPQPPIPPSLPPVLPQPVISNTRQRFEFLEKKIKSSFGSAVSTSATNLTIEPQSLSSSNPSTPVADSNTIIPLQQPVTTPNQSPQSFITASSHFLVDYFCSVSECSLNEQLLGLDLINLLTDKQKSSENDSVQKRNLKKTRDIKLEKENLISYNNVPIQIEETYTFDLNSETKYLNIFLWTIQCTNKMSKMKNLLIGYITLPLNEINVDCWNTSKGETQTTAHFCPLDEFKASAASAKMSKSHVISTHAGFDSSLSVGSLTLNFQHKLKKTLVQDQLQPAVAVQDQLPVVEIDEKKLTDTIVDELNEQNLIQTNFSKSEKKSESIIDDGSIHKFVPIQFNESVACEFCNKKIWFKSAFKCIYCDYKIHMKCYDKAFGKTICPRFFSKNKQINSNELDAASLNSQYEPFEMINTNNQMEPMDKTNDDLLAHSSSGTSTTRSLVTNFLSGIRQRRNHSESQNQNSFSLLNSFSLNVSRIRPSNIITRNNLNTNNNNSNLITDDLSNVDLDEFKDIDSNEEKLFGTELFDELPPEERQEKLNELINKYQSAIEMMKKLKSDHEKELDQILKSKKNRVQKTFLNSAGLFNQKEERLRSEIKHTDEQMKCVMFLLMQCQIGLDNCIDLQSLNQQNNLNNSPGSKKSLNNEINLEPTVTNDNVDDDDDDDDDDNNDL